MSDLTVIPKKTGAAMAEAGATLQQVRYVILHGKIPRPQRDSSGDYVWTDGDIARLRAAVQGLRPRRMRPVIVSQSPMPAISA